MIRVDASIENPLFSALAEKAFDKLSLSGEAIVEVDFVSKEEIRELNRKTRNIDRATDVLSFPSLDTVMPFTKEHYPFEYDSERGAVTLGSIVICDEVAREQAKEYGHSVERERCYLFVHGLMHLLGYDHIEESDRAIMREREESVLTALDITRRN